MVRELTAKDVLFTPHPPINRSPFSRWRRLFSSLATLFSHRRRLFSPSQALCASSPKGRAKDVGAYRRAEHAPPLRRYEGTRTVEDADPYEIDVVFWMDVQNCRDGSGIDRKGRIIYTSSISLRLTLDVLLRKTRWSLATLFSRWRRLFPSLATLFL